MGFGSLKKLTIAVALAFWVIPVFAVKITLVHESEGAPDASGTFELEDGIPLTHDLLSGLIQQFFNFSSKDLDLTTVAIINEEDPSLNINVDLELAGEINEFAELITEGRDLTLTVIKNTSEDMSDVDSSSSGNSETAAAVSNLITIVYDSPVEQGQCEYVYDADEYGGLTYLKLRQIMIENCGVAQEIIDKCYAGLEVYEDIIPLVDMAHSNSMRPILGLHPGSVIRVFNWAT